MPTIKLMTPKKRDKTYNKQATQAVYNTPRWKQLRAFKLMMNPICEKCEALGITRQTTEIHHKVPFDINDTPERIEELAYDYNNLESLCDDCHHLETYRLRHNKV